jgi:signal transduction histidine kinase/CheY-like chemotaxis protein/HPt (histidine-containing phosphotransfer) domain-containing protein
MKSEIELQRFGLRFSHPEAEREFLKFYDSQFIRHSRAAMVLGIGLIFIDALVDYIAAPIESHAGNLIRVLFVNLLFTILLAGSYVDFLKKHFQSYVCVMFSFGSIGLLYSVELIANSNAPVISAWVGIINYFFVIIFVFLIMGLRLFAGAIGGALITLGYFVIMAILKDLDTYRFIYSVYHISTIYVLGLFLGYIRELYVRRDFAAQRELRIGQESLLAAKDSAERANRAKSEFLATMSHELRTPLNGILGMTRLALEKDGARGELRPMLETIERSGATLRKLIDDVLDINRIEAGRLFAAREVFVLADLLHEVIAIVQPLAAERDTRIEVQIDGNVLTRVEAELAHLRQVLLNLLGNAVKFTRQGRICVSVAAEGMEAGRVRLSFSVSDTGIGIPADQLDRVFEPLTQASNTMAGRYGGTGLGLAIVKRLVGAMGGNIGVESTLGKGSTFTFDIVVKDAAADHGQAQVPVSPTTPTEPLRLLLVEDDTVNQQVATGFLELAGHHVVVAQTGAEAIFMAGERSFDAILMDIRLPDITGLTAMEAIRAGEAAATRPTPVIALTANVMPGEVQRYLDAGMAAVVAKPIDAEKLHAALGQVLRGHRTHVTSEPLAVPRAFDAGQFSVLASSFAAPKIVALLGELDRSIVGSIAAIENEMTGGRYEAVARRAHRLAGAAANFALRDLHASAASLEAAASTGNDHTAIARAAAKVISQATRARMDISALCDTLQRNAKLDSLQTDDSVRRCATNS